MLIEWVLPNFIQSSKHNFKCSFKITVLIIINLWYNLDINES